MREFAVHLGRSMSFTIDFIFYICDIVMRRRCGCRRSSHYTRAACKKKPALSTLDLECARAIQPLKASTQHSLFLLDLHMFVHHPSPAPLLSTAFGPTRRSSSPWRHPL